MASENYLEKADLVTLNIISSEEANKVQYIKNSAISGLYKLILTRDFQRVQHISNQTKVIYLEKDPDFNDYWIDAMVFFMIKSFIDLQNIRILYFTTRLIT